MPVKSAKLPVIAVGVILGGPELYKGLTDQVCGLVTAAFSSPRSFELAARSGILNVIVGVPGSIWGSYAAQTEIGPVSRSGDVVEIRVVVPGTFVRARREATPLSPEAEESWQRRFTIYLLLQIKHCA